MQVFSSPATGYATAYLKSLITRWIQDSEKLVMVLEGEQCQCCSVTYSLDFSFTGVRTVNSSAWAKVQLISRTPSWQRVHRTLYIFCTELVCVTATHCKPAALFQARDISFSIFPLSLALWITMPVKSFGALIMQRKTTVCSWSTSGPKSYHAI